MCLSSCPPPLCLICMGDHKMSTLVVSHACEMVLCILDTWCCPSLCCRLRPIVCHDLTPTPNSDPKAPLKLPVPVPSPVQLHSAFILIFQLYIIFYLNYQLSIIFYNHYYCL